MLGLFLILLKGMYCSNGDSFETGRSCLNLRQLSCALYSEEAIAIGFFFTSFL